MLIIVCVALTPLRHPNQGVNFIDSVCQLPSNVVNIFLDSPDNLLVKYSKDKVYQNDEEAGKISGPVRKSDNYITFERIDSTNSSVQLGSILKYQKRKCKIDSIGTLVNSDIGSTATDRGVRVLEAVRCKKIGR